MIVRVIDFETTGVEPPCHPVEVAAIDLDTERRRFTIVGSTRIKPPIPIPPDARAIHHISDAEVENAPTLAEVLPRYLDTVGIEDIAALAAHNMNFDGQFIGEPIHSPVCTLRCSYVLFPDAPSYANAALVYWLQDQGKAAGFDPTIAGTTHRAWGDAYTTACLLREMLTLRSLDELIEMTEHPVLLPKLTFGKHKGLRYEDAPLDYLQWMLRQPDMDADRLFTARHYLDLAQSGALFSPFADPAPDHFSFFKP